MGPGLHNVHYLNFYVQVEKIVHVMQARPRFLFVAEGNDGVKIGSFFSRVYSEKQSD